MRERGRLTRGTVLGDMVVDRLVGEGAVAEVYAVTTPAGPRALKLARPGLDPELHEALRLEAVLQAGAASPYVVALDRLVEVELASLPDGSPDRRPGLLMELVEGPTLDRWQLRQDDPVPVALALSLFEGIVLGTRAVHASGAVHRDLKPDNVLMSGAPGAWVPKLTDFGMAKALVGPADALEDPERGLSLHYRIVGTPAYMAPEQAMGAADATERSDLYSLGCILYELLCDDVPYPAREPREVLRRAILGDHVPVRQVRADVEPRLEALIADLLEPDPSQRIASADQLLQRLAAG